MPRNLRVRDPQKVEKCSGWSISFSFIRSFVRTMHEWLRSRSISSCEACLNGPQSLPHPIPNQLRWLPWIDDTKISHIIKPFVSPVKSSYIFVFFLWENCLFCSPRCFGHSMGWTRIAMFKCEVHTQHHPLDSHTSAFEKNKKREWQVIFTVGIRRWRRGILQQLSNFLWRLTTPTFNFSLKNQHEQMLLCVRYQRIWAPLTSGMGWQCTTHARRTLVFVVLLFTDVIY